ncbi:ABC-2 type transport system permease protein [Halobacillus karajensis]|uniref:ABC transporter permease n=1 Tax=Halobacillus karajensis TaxID=195088 RepID=UPI0008A81011|nr:ABC transporter permease subunit [Halobacillus karajensis]SEH51090.1 ABC-2 type transport system permease protein [Halobacillus karajensis]
MWAISTHEFKNLFKSVRAIVIILFLTGMSLLVASLAENFAENFGAINTEGQYTAGLSATIIFFGMLFVFILSHDTISSEVQNRTMRFLVSKTSRKSIIIGKALGISIFWLTTVLLSLLIVSFVSKAFFFETFLHCSVFLFYGACTAILISSLSKKGPESLFFGIIVSILLPAISFATVFIDSVFIQWVKYLTPYYYMDLSIAYLPIVCILSIIILAVSIKIFERRDL